MSQPTYEVHLAVYDLSRGMARALSGQFLGGAEHAIDIIPHTGLVVYGKEYFYGGGIQSESPAIFRQATGMFPISTELLGRTTVSRQEFEAWCRDCMRAGRFTIESYDLLERNCNNFCHEAAIEGLRLPSGIPEWILNVPRRFLASPMGQIIRPMLESMQVTGGHAASAAPFANAAPSLASTTSSSSEDTSSVNPWANLPSSSTSASASDPCTREKLTTDSLKTPVLDSFTRPLISNDANTATLCANKLIANTENDDDKIALQQVSDTLVHKEKPSEELVQKSSKAILNQLESNDKAAMFALMLLRLIMLHPPASIDETSSFGQCIEWVQSQLSSNGTLFASPAARSMAWCTLSNAYGTCPNLINSLDASVESAMNDLPPDSQPRVEVRQAAVAFLYNVCLVESLPNSNEDLSDLLVSLLCACLDGLALETDATCQLRRLVVAGKIVKPSNDDVNTAAKSLVNNLGFTESLQATASSSKSTNVSGDAANVQKVTNELIQILES